MATRWVYCRLVLLGTQIVFKVVIKGGSQSRLMMGMVSKVHFNLFPEETIINFFRLFPQETPGNSSSRGTLFIRKHHT